MITLDGFVLPRTQRCRSKMNIRRQEQCEGEFIIVEVQ